MADQYFRESTPNGKPATVDESMEAVPMTTLEKAFRIIIVASYVLGSILFLSGSILLYPKYASLWNGNAPLAGVWIYIFGCVFFVIGTQGDFINSARSCNQLSTGRRVVTMYNASCYILAALIFQLGSVYFLPDYYGPQPTIGCWSFIIGCILFCFGALVDIAFICITHDDRNKRGVDLWNLVSWNTVVAIGTFVGAMCFIVGSYYYLPQFINDEKLGTHYINLALNWYVVGSVFFLINGLAQIPGLLEVLRFPSSFEKKQVGDHI